MENRKHVMHILSILGLAGTEYGVVKLLNKLDPEEFRCSIVSLSTIHSSIKDLCSPHITLKTIRKSHGMFYLSTISSLAKYARRQKVDIIHTHNWSTYYFGYCASCLTNTKLVHGEHGRDTERLALTNRRKLLQKIFSKKTSHLIAVSNDIRDGMIKYWNVNGAKIQVIPNGVDFVRFDLPENLRSQMRSKMKISSETVVIGSVGVLRKIKNHGLLFTVFKKIIDSYPELQIALMIVGDNPNDKTIKDKMQNQANKMGISDHIIWCGMRTDIPELMTCMDIYVNTSLFEGMSNTILEAMASKIPIVASDVGGNPELVKHNVNGYLFAVNNETQLIDYLVKLSRNETLRKTMGERGREWVRAHHSLQHMVNMNIDIYRNIF